MFFPIIIIAIGLAIILNALGLLNGTFWGVFWGVLFLAIGIKMMYKANCPVCGWRGFHGKMHGKTHGECQCGHDHGGHQEDEGN